MSTEVQWLPGMPDEYRKAIEKPMAKYLYLVPSWCHRLTVGYNAEPPEDLDDCVAGVSVDFQYRHAAIDVYPAFLEEPPPSREKAIAHEILHIALQPLVDIARSIAERVMADDALRVFIGEEITARLEGSVADLTQAVCRGIKP